MPRRDRPGAREGSTGLWDRPREGSARLWDGPGGPGPLFPQDQPHFLLLAFTFLGRMPADQASDGHHLKWAG